MKRLLALIVLLAPLAGADEIYLKSGRKVTGMVVERTATMLIVDVGPGRVGFPLAMVDRVTSAESDLSGYRERAARLRPDDAAAWVALGHWARGRGLETQASEAFERALGSDPGSVAANLGLGRELVNGRWMTFAERQAARGLVEFEGQWMSPAQRDARLAADEATGRARQAEARARAAEAQVAEAEARAREAEAHAQEAAQQPQEGLPWAWGGTSGIACVHNCQPGCPCVTRPRPESSATPPPPRAVKPPSTGLVSPTRPTRPRPSQGLAAPRD